MSPQDFEQHLRDLDRTAVPILRRPGREIWQCDLGGTPALLHFYPTTGHLSRGPATKAFANLKALHTAKVQALRPIAMLSGLQFGVRKGDAILTDAPGVPALELTSETSPDAAAQAADSPGDDSTSPVDESTACAVASDVPRDAAVQPLSHGDAQLPDHRVRAALVEWLAQIAKAGFGHTDLRPDAFLINGDRVFLADAAALTRGGLTREHLAQFAHALGDRASKADRLRAWRRLVDNSEDSAPPTDRSEQARIARDVRNDAVGRVTADEWTGHFRVTGTLPTEWSIASRLFVTADDWQREWPLLLERLRTDQLDVLKSDTSGDVMAGLVTLAGVPVDVIVKRPRNKFWYRYLLDAFRHSRARRTWEKTLRLQARQLPVEYPLLVMERRVGGYVVEAVAVFEKVAGVTLEEADLDAMPAAARENFFRRCGRILRRIEDTGLAHPDAKSSNWIVFQSATRGPTPVLIDAYGVRRLTRGLQLLGIQRLLRAMRQHPQYAPADSLHLCLGFSPRTPPEGADAH